eukprot:CAMPEP_0182585226 /NCGR_PEP_ID=MMETSP1324-20130603/59835_1 /TAXON_ID=236786 /ORGANISM="Florenciella sp., Strain RCC1587" /LENGTH=292 /DNA_ID=CAMNT_0024802009 /DNA_START=39 /DNA_END=918 /DNA_ORIENTATION=+
MSQETPSTTGAEAAAAPVETTTLTQSTSIPGPPAGADELNESCALPGSAPAEAPAINGFDLVGKWVEVEGITGPAEVVAYTKQGWAASKLLFMNSHHVLRLETGEERDMLLKRWKMGAWNGGLDFKVIDRSAAITELQNDLRAKMVEVDECKARLQKMEAGMEAKEKEVGELKEAVSSKDAQIKKLEALLQADREAWTVLQNTFMNTDNEWDEGGEGSHSDTSDEEGGEDDGHITIKKAIRIGRRMSSAGLDRTMSLDPSGEGKADGSNGVGAAFESGEGGFDLWPRAQTWA